MLPKLSPLENQYGAPLERFVPADVPGMLTMRPEDREIWGRAKSFLHVRDNDAHTIYAYGLARALCDANPDADEAVVLPAILLHDTGWSQVPEELVLQAISPSGGDPELVLRHEREGVRIATEILSALPSPWRPAPEAIAEICAIISTHDSTKTAASLNDAIVKDADKLWRLSPHGIDTIMDWFGLDRNTATRLCSWRVHDHLHTPAARLMARGFGAVASVDGLAERIELG